MRYARIKLQLGNTFLSHNQVYHNNYGTALKRETAVNEDGVLVIIFHREWSLVSSGEMTGVVLIVHPVKLKTVRTCTDISHVIC